jgi:nucleotide-binding universal stress UspA family protein
MEVSMLLTKRILVATDFAAPSEAAADIGLELAKQFHVPIVLLHALSVPAQIYAGVSMAATDDYAALYVKAAQEALANERARLASTDAKVVAVLRRGEAWKEILSAAREIDAAVIVMGTHGRHGLPRAVLGSVAEKVVRLSPIPVLTVHGKAHGPTP